MNYFLYICDDLFLCNSFSVSLSKCLVECQIVCFSFYFNLSKAGKFTDAIGCVTFATGDHALSIFM